MKRSEEATIIATRLAADLYRAEGAQDQSINRLARLAQSMTRSRAQAKLAATVGQPAFDALSRAIGAQVEAQAALVDLHNALADVKASTSFRTVAIGGVRKSDEPVPRTEGRASLELAA